MIENLVPIKLPPGLFANGTKYQAAGRWNSGNLVRFHEGTIQPIGGWAQRPTSGAVISGVPLAAICWQLADGTPFLAVGTTTGLYVIDNGDVVYNITPDPATMHAAPFDWQLSTFGAYLVAVNSLRGDDDLSLVNTYVWTGNTATLAASAWTTAIGPRGAYSGFATPERFLTMLRGEDPTTEPARTGVDGVYSERRVYWASQEQLDGFVSTDINTGGNFDIQTEGRLVVGAAARSQSLIWSDVDLWAMNYIGGELIYSFQNVGRSCGIVSKRAFVLLDKGAYWMGRGKFFVYDGFVRSVPCEVTDAVFSDFNESRAHIVWAFANPRFNEVTWFYPSRGSQYADRYVTFNYAEEHWTFGVQSRTVGVPQRFRQDVVDEPKPVMFDSNGIVFDHETGDERDAQAYLVSGPIELGAGDRLMRVQGIMPDDLTSGDVALRLYTAMSPDGLEALNGPFTLGTFTNLRLTTRQVRVRLEEASAKSWRVGTVRLAVLPVERRGASAGTADTTPASIEVVPAAITLISAQHYTFQAIIRNAAGEVLDLEPDQWHSDNATQVSIDSTGTVTALATPATANITASLLTPALTSNAAVVTVIGDNVPVSITISPTPFDSLPTRTTQLTAVFRNAAGQIITSRTPDSWASSDPTKSTVNSTGLVTGVASSGSTNITAHSLSPALTSNIAVANSTDPYYTHTFGPAAGAYTFSVTTLGTGAIRALLVGGGGSGGSVDGSGVAAGGGGGGGVVDTTQTLGATGDYAVFVGEGGVPTHADHTLGIGSATGSKGLNSTFNGLTADGGGAGRSNDASSTTIMDGGSAGGAVSTLEDIDFPSGAITTNPGGTGVVGQGHNGGAGTNDPTSTGTFQFGGGGGGGGAVGASHSSGAGGAGVSSDITGTATTYAGGGGAGYMGASPGSHSGAPGGAGGGAYGGGEPADSGVDGLGGGGGGGSGTLGNDGGHGGNGVVIVRYTVASGIVATGGTKVLHS